MYGAELVALRIAIELSIKFRNKLKMMGILKEQVKSYVTIRVLYSVYTEHYYLLILKDVHAVHLNPLRSFWI